MSEAAAAAEILSTTQPDKATAILVSPATEIIKTPDGFRFRVLRNTSQEVRENRAAALGRMIAILESSGHQTAETPLQELSWEYISSRLVKNTEDPGQKAELARVWIGELIEEGSYAKAVDGLLYGDVPKADIPEMQNPDFVGKLFAAAQQAGDTLQAHRIAQTVASLEQSGQRGKLFKTPRPESEFNAGWKARETTLFEKRVVEALDRARGSDSFDPDTYSELGMLYIEWGYRDEGYYSDHPHPLAIDTAKAYCDLILQRGTSTAAQERAYTLAVESKLPPADIERYESGLSNPQQVRTRLTRHLQSLLAGLARKRN